jgi:hypothetical protein
MRAIQVKCQPEKGSTGKSGEQAEIDLGAGATVPIDWLIGATRVALSYNWKLISPEQSVGRTLWRVCRNDASTRKAGLT